MLKFIASTCAILLSFAFMAPAAAQSSATRGYPVSVEIVDRDAGRTLDNYAWRNQLWVAGEPGHRYSMRLQNHSNERLLAVVSVDGVNVLTGETAAFDQGGYVLNPYQSVEVTGWRKSLYDVASFVFSSPGDSYAARTGRPMDLGVLGVVVFREYQRPVVIHRPQIMEDSSGSSARSSEAMPAPSARASAEKSVSQGLGTAHGDREASYASRTTFSRVSNIPSQKIAIRYDSWENLAARGVIVERWKAGRDNPNPFPGFVPDPY